MRIPQNDEVHPTLFGFFGTININVEPLRSRSEEPVEEAIGVGEETERGSNEGAGSNGDSPRVVFGHGYLPLGYASPLSQPSSVPSESTPSPSNVSEPPDMDLDRNVSMAASSYSGSDWSDLAGRGVNAAASGQQASPTRSLGSEYHLSEDAASDHSEFVGPRPMAWNGRGRLQLRSNSGPAAPNAHQLEQESQAAQRRLELLRSYFPEDQVAAARAMSEEQLTTLLREGAAAALESTTAAGVLGNAVRTAVTSASEAVQRAATGVRRLTDYFKVTRGPRPGHRG